MHADRIIAELRTRLLSLANVWPYGHLALWMFIAKEAKIDPRSVYNFATEKAKMHNPRLSTVRGLERAIVQAEAHIRTAARVANAATDGV